MSDPLDARADVGRCAVWDCAVFTFNALVSIMQFVADEDTLRAWCSGRWAAWLAHHGRNWRAGGGDGDCFTLVAASCLAASALRLGEERAMSFGIDVRRLAWVPCCASACWRPFRLRLWGNWLYWPGCTAYFPPVAGRRYRFYLPGSILIGGLVLSLAS